MASENPGPAADPGVAESVPTGFPAAEGNAPSTLEQTVVEAAQPAGAPANAESSAAVGYPGAVQSPHAAGDAPGSARVQLPFSPPEAVQQWLRDEDWQALSNAWADAEDRALVWAEGEEELSADDACLWTGRESAASSRASVVSSPAPSLPGFATRRRKPLWNNDFHLIGKDSRRPAPLRRYFDYVPGENNLPREPERQDVKMARLKKERDMIGLPPKNAPKNRPDWCTTHEQNVTADNTGLHPSLRHYFDRRGIESSYRQRPHVDKVSPVLLPRTPRRPSTREKMMRFTASEPSLQLKAPHECDEIDVERRGIGNIHWGTRCLLYGPDKQLRETPTGGRIPWVYDYNRVESEDNEILNPMLRHYFEVDGIESSFRNRGRHYGRKLPAVMGLEIPTPSTTAPDFSTASGGKQDISGFEANFHSVGSGLGDGGSSPAGDHSTQLASFEASMEAFAAQMKAGSANPGLVPGDSSRNSGRKSGRSKGSTRSSNRR